MQAHLTQRIGVPARAQSHPRQRALNIFAEIGTLAEQATKATCAFEGLWRAAVFPVHAT